MKAVGKIWICLGRGAWVRQSSNESGLIHDLMRTWKHVKETG